MRSKSVRVVIGRANRYVYNPIRKCFECNGPTKADTYETAYNWQDHICKECQRSWPDWQYRVDKDWVRAYEI